MSRPFLSCFIMLLALAACQTDAPNAPTDTGSGYSGYTNAYSGGISRPVAAPKPKPPINDGFLLSAWQNNPICTAMDDDDRSKDAQAERRACNAPIGQKVTWNNPDTGMSGTIVAVNDGYNATGAYCRDFVQTIAANGHEQQLHSKACQRPDGTWTPAS